MADASHAEKIRSKSQFKFTWLRKRSWSVWSHIASQHRLHLNKTAYVF